MFIIIDIYGLHYDIMKRHICQCVCPGYCTGRLHMCPKDYGKRVLNDIKA